MAFNYLGSCQQRGIGVGASQKGLQVPELLELRGDNFLGLFHRVGMLRRRLDGGRGSGHGLDDFTGFALDDAGQMADEYTCVQLVHEISRGQLVQSCNKVVESSSELINIELWCAPNMLKRVRNLIRSGPAAWPALKPNKTARHK